MGRPKPGLPIGPPGQTFLGQLLATFMAAGLPDIVVVTGSHAAQVRAAAGRVRAPVRFAHNEDWPRGQLSSLWTGLAARPGVHVEAALVALVDTPLVSAATITAVMRAWRQTGAPIVRPARGTEHGHPVLFDCDLFGELLAADPAAGAKPVVRAQRDKILDLPVDDPGAFLDFDTPEDLSRVP